MCNEQKATEEKKYDYRFLDYRLNQYETKLDKGLEKLEQGQTQNYTEIMKTLHILQQNNNDQNKQLIEISQRQKATEEKIKCIEKLKEVATSHNQKIKNLERRIDIYKQILFWVGTAAGGGLILAVLDMILK